MLRKCLRLIRTYTKHTLDSKASLAFEMLVYRSALIRAVIVMPDTVFASEAITAESTSRDCARA